MLPPSEKQVLTHQNCVDNGHSQPQTSPSQCLYYEDKHGSIFNHLSLKEKSKINNGSSELNSCLL